MPRFGGLPAALGWTLLLNILVYSWSYYTAKDAVAALSKSAGALPPGQLLVAQALGALIVGIVADNAGPRAALTITHLGSIAVYACATALEMKTVSSRVNVDPAKLAQWASIASSLQHTMMATQVAVCVHLWGSRAKAFVVLVVINLAYQTGMLAASHGPAAETLIPAAYHREPVVKLILAARALLPLVVTLLVVVWNYVAVGFPGSKISFQLAATAKAPARAASIRPAKMWFMRVLLRSLPMVALVLALRFARLTVMAYRTNKFGKTGSEALGTALPIPIDNLLTLTAYAFVLVIALAMDGPGPLAVAMPIVLALTRGATVIDPRAMDGQAGTFYVVLGLAGGVLYMLPNAVAATWAAPGTKGRVLGMCTAASMVMMNYHSAMYKAALAFVTAEYPKFTPLKLSANELDFLVTALVLAGALVLGLALQPGSRKQHVAFFPEANSLASLEAPAAATAAKRA